MPKYTPKVSDPVSIIGKGLVRYVIVSVDSNKQTADVKSISGAIGIHRGVPWSELQRLDSSQNALSIVREATEDK